ncbi:MAG: hypothetical protein NW226_07225 [Microscillaceae bacterium]|nr:hypothetical protein [Microscillaceae bacterium]
MKTNHFRLFLVLSGFCALFLSACSDDDTPPPVNEEELITTVKLTFTPTGGGTAITATWKDLDGEGSGAPDLSQATATLQANTSYTLAVEFLNESESPAEDITEEVEEEAEEHILYFSVTNGLFSSFTYADDDAPDSAGDGVFALGLNTNLSTGTGTPATGTLSVTLLHESDKSVGGGTSNGGNVKAVPSGAGGETDIAVDFTINVQ